MEIQYDKQNKRLLYFKANGSDSWDKVWQSHDIKEACLNLSRYNFVDELLQDTFNLRKALFLKPGAA